MSQENCNIENITPVIITKNSELYMDECLKSLENFKEVIVYDNGSTDKTIDICKSYQNVKVNTGEFFGFGPTKNLAATLAKTEWILSIDSDEVVTPELLEEIKKLDLSNQNSVYKINRQNLFMKCPVKYSGWNPDWIVRIYNKKHTSFCNQKVHESIQIHKNTNVILLKGRLKHYAVNDLSDFLIKTARYSSIERENQKCYPPFVIFFRALFAFFRTYILKKGFLDGYKGLVISVGNFNGVFFKYMQKYQRCKK
jgi:glycosyltransferase involved in cell wall biosynthesis